MRNGERGRCVWGAGQGRVGMTAVFEGVSAAPIAWDRGGRPCRRAPGGEGGAGWHHSSAPGPRRRRRTGRGGHEGHGGHGGHEDVGGKEDMEDTEDMDGMEDMEGMEVAEDTK